MLVFACAPAVLAVTMSGGAVALLPLALLILPILALGRPAGIEALERVLAAERAPSGSRSVASVRGLREFTPRTRNPIADALAERAPPTATAAT